VANNISVEILRDEASVKLRLKKRYYGAADGFPSSSASRTA